MRMIALRLSNCLNRMTLSFKAKSKNVTVGHLLKTTRSRGFVLLVPFKDRVREDEGSRARFAGECQSQLSTLCFRPPVLRPDAVYVCSSRYHARLDFGVGTEFAFRVYCMTCYCVQDIYLELRAIVRTLVISYRFAFLLSSLLLLFPLIIQLFSHVVFVVLSSIQVQRD